MAFSPTVAVATLLCTATIAFAQPSTRSPLADLRELQLQVEKAEVVERVTIGDDLTKKAEPGFRLWVVTLRGVVPRPCRISLSPSSFTAIWEREEEFYGRRGLRAHVTPAENLKADSRWVASIENIYGKALPEERIVILISLPEDVKTFRVTYGAFAGGVAKQPGA